MSKFIPLVILLTLIAVKGIVLITLNHFHPASNSGWGNITVMPLKNNVNLNPPSDSDLFLSANESHGY